MFDVAACVIWVVLGLYSTFVLGAKLVLNRVSTLIIE